MKTMGVAHERTGVRVAVALGCLVAACGFRLSAQDATDTKQILERLDRLERQNAELLKEVRELRTQLQSAKTTETQELAETVAVQQARIDDQAQSKVEASHKLPLRITGMALFNSYYFAPGDGAFYNPTVPIARGRAEAGGTLSQSILGLEYWNGDGILGARIHGNLYMDFFGNTETSSTYGSTQSGYAWPLPRLRTGTVSLDWSSRSVMVGVDKPLIAPSNPDSLAQVALPALSGAGNLWLWQPQVRFEQRLRASETNTFRLQTSVYETDESYGYGAAPSTLEPSRPAWEARVAFAHRAGEDTGFEIAPGFHLSTTHVAGRSVNSHIASLDGRFAIMRWWNIAGTIFTGQNVAGVGGVGPGFALDEYGDPQPVHATGGWLQLTLAPTSRLSFHLFGGEQSNRRSDLRYYYNGIDSNAAYAGNVYFQLAPNVFAAFEAGQVRTNWTWYGKRLRNQYDLSLAYLF